MSTTKYMGHKYIFKSVIFCGWGYNPIENVEMMFLNAILCCNHITMKASFRILNNAHMEVVYEL